MARLPRFVIPGQPQHIIQRGNNRQTIFGADADYRFFRGALVEAATQHGLAIHAYVWMTNHIHLLATPENINFSERFVGFTGNFDGYTRKTCFEEIRKHGGVPCDPHYFTDYFFVANKSIGQVALSNQFGAAIYFRRLYGRPLIFKEENWHEILRSHSNKSKRT